MNKKIINTIIVLIGLTLSPITWWNDPFVNIPLSYLLATMTAYFFPKIFAVSFIIYYWLTNVLGIFLTQYGGKGLITSFNMSRKRQIITIIVYTIILLGLSVCGIIRPVALK